MSESEIHMARAFAFLHPLYRMATWPVVGDWVAQFIGQQSAQKIVRLRQAGLL